MDFKIAVGEEKITKKLNELAKSKKRWAIGLPHDS